jgi:hypothetical protein
VLLYRSGFLETIPHTIPISDSPESIALRIAAVESMISTSLSKHMLHTVFPWSNSENSQSNILEHILEGLLHTNPQKEAILRTIVSTSQLPNVKRSEASAISLIVKEVTDKCAPILTLLQSDRTSTFQDPITKFLEDALHVWKDAQRSEFRIVATSTIRDAIHEWGEQDEHQAEVTTNTSQDLITQEPVVVLFPQVYETNGRTVIHPGAALWSDCRIYQLGKREYRAQHTRNHELLGGSTSRVRQTCANLK